MPDAASAVSRKILGDLQPFVALIEAMMGDGVAAAPSSVVSPINDDFSIDLLFPPWCPRPCSRGSKAALRRIQHPSGVALSRLTATKSKGSQALTKKRQTEPVVVDIGEETLKTINIATESVVENIRATPQVEAQPQEDYSLDKETIADVVTNFFYCERLVANAHSAASRPSRICPIYSSRGKFISTKILETSRPKRSATLRPPVDQSCSPKSKREKAVVATPEMPMADATPQSLDRAKAAVIEKMRVHVRVLSAHIEGFCLEASRLVWRLRYEERAHRVSCQSWSLHAEGREHGED